MTCPLQLSVRPRAANILSSRQPSCVEEICGAECPHQQVAGRHREAKCKAGGAAISSSSNTISIEERSIILTSSKTHNLHEDSVKAAVKVMVRLKKKIGQIHYTLFIQSFNDVFYVLKLTSALGA